MASAVRMQKSKVTGVFPREHGAYVTLLTPLASGLLFAPSLGALGWALVAFALFVAHEPLCVLLGRRGARKRELDGGAAWRALVLIASFTLLVTLVLTLSSDALTQRALLLSGLACACAGLMFAARREKTLAGELVVTDALVGLCLPALALSSVPPRQAAHFVFAWLAVHGLAMLTARAYVYRKREGPGLLRVATAVAVMLAIGALAAIYTGRVSINLGVAPCLVALVTLALKFGAFQPRSPKQLGWALAAAMLPGVALIGLALR